MCYGLCVTAQPQEAIGLKDVIAQKEK